MSDLTAKIRELARLLEEGLITQQQFETERDRLFAQHRDPSAPDAPPPQAAAAPPPRPAAPPPGAPRARSAGKPGMGRGKKIGVGAVLGLGLVAVIAVFFFMKAMKGGDIDEVASRLPDDTAQLMVFRGMGDLALEFKSTVDSVKGLPGANLAVEEIKKKAQPILGFDPTSVSAWLDSGLDFTRPWAFALSGMDPDSSPGTFWVPVSKPDAVLGMVLRVIAEDSSLEHAVDASGEHKVRERGRDVLAYRMVDDYLVFSFTTGRPDAAALSFRKVERDRSLAENPDFQKVLEGVGDDWHMFSYLSPQWLGFVMDVMPSSFGLKPVLIDTLGLRAIGGSTYLSDSSLKGRNVMTHFEGRGLHNVLSRRGEDALAKRLSGQPLFVSRVSLDPAGIWGLGVNLPMVGPELRKGATEIRRELGFDLKTDLIDVLGGNVSFIATKGGKMGVEFVAYTDLKDGKKAQATMDTVLTKAERATGGLLFTVERQDGVWVQVDEVVVGLSGDHLIVTNRPMSQIRREVAKGAKDSLLSNLPSRVRSELESGPAVYGYFDVHAAVSAVEDSAFLGREMGITDREALGMIKALLRGGSFSVQQSDEYLRIGYAFDAGPKGFGQGLIEVVTAVAIPNYVGMQYRAKRAEVPSNVDGIKTAQIAYDAQYDTYVEQTALYPTSRPGKEQLSWPSGSNFDDLGWGPDGKVRGAYRVVSTSSTDFLITGICDVDGDGIYATFTATKSINTTMVTPANVY